MGSMHHESYGCVVWDTIRRVGVFMLCGQVYLRVGFVTPVVSRLVL